MEKYCEMCSEIATKRDYNGSYFCKNHIANAKKSERKAVKRVTLEDDTYWSAVKLGAEINMDVHKFVTALIIDRMTSNYKNKLQA
nr:hypothetical protein GTC16762_33710 [Pigmentibacter ruber]